LAHLRVLANILAAWLCSGPRRPNGYCSLPALAHASTISTHNRIGGIPLPREQRRLAAIVAADVVDYARLMGLDESGTLARPRVRGLANGSSRARDSDVRRELPLHRFFRAGMASAQPTAAGVCVAAIASAVRPGAKASLSGQRPTNQPPSIIGQARVTPTVDHQPPLLDSVLKCCMHRSATRSQSPPLAA